LNKNTTNKNNPENLSQGSGLLEATNNLESDNGDSDKDRNQG
jgi:hypothetical protein